VIVTATQPPTEQTKQQSDPATEAPTTAPIAEVPTATPAFATDSLIGLVGHGGNVRAQPNIKGHVLDQLHANEQVQLTQRSADGLWYQIVNVRGVRGWVSTTLLKIDGAIASQVSAPAYQKVDIRELDKNPDSFKEQPLRITGSVFNIDESNGQTFLQIWVRIPGGSVYDTKAVSAVFDGTLDGIYEDTVVTVFGIGGGTFEGTNSYGGPITQPLIQISYVQL
jgi:hypothetical protein